MAGDSLVKLRLECVNVDPSPGQDGLIENLGTRQGGGD